MEKQLKKLDQFSDVPGVYGARRRLCNPEKGEMFQGYEMMECEELLEKYQEKNVANAEPILKQDKKAKGDISNVFKQMDRLNFRVNNAYYGKA